MFVKSEYIEKFSDFVADKNLSEHTKDEYDYNYFVNVTGYTADEIIENEKYHFSFLGLKFVSIDLIKKYKSGRKDSREKDKNDIRLIELFEEMAMVYDEKMVLKKRIFEEMKQRRLNQN